MLSTEVDLKIPSDRHRKLKPYNMPSQNASPLQVRPSMEHMYNIGLWQLASIQYNIN